MVIDPSRWGGRWNAVGRLGAKHPGLVAGWFAFVAIVAFSVASIALAKGHIHQSTATWPAGTIFMFLFGLASTSLFVLQVRANVRRHRRERLQG